MSSAFTYDVAIVGGGLAGLTTSIQLANAGWKVVLFEKESYPFHRVCGEYISLESRAFLRGLGIDDEALDLPIIDQLQVSAPNGKLLEQRLPLGGMGISRYRLDQLLAEIATKAGVLMMDHTRVNEAIFEKDGFTLHTPEGNYRSRIAVGSFGKRSNLDVKMNREFIRQKASGLNNFIGIKYHIRYAHARDTIVLHNFSDGYCGMSAIENGLSCLCYLTTAANLERSGKSIPRMEQEILSQNPHLERIFRDADFVFREPVAISQISFAQKSLIENHILMAGDAAGMITPLCGNGMSMGMHAGKIMTGKIDAFLSGKISREEMEQSYQQVWTSAFSGRLRTGRMIQRMFGKPMMTNLFISAMKPFPRAVNWLVKQTHGAEF
ncbi:MAG: NAD(P)/FAD-dependent oxidoreductase [Sphingobacteriales bacterium]|nr:MAG: NAD(P)/FAD-dependent oxidoreductase [Sphingobacteriales bacterium]